MGKNYYTDIETTGFDFEKDKIITIQYQEIDSFTGEPKGELTILKEWESSEENIVKKFYNLLMVKDTWSYIPIGTNFSFDLNFLFTKFKKYNLPCPELGKYLFGKPLIDLKYTLILANNMAFKGSGLDQMSKKKADGKNVPNWYVNEQYNKIEEYIIQEKDSFIEIFQKIFKDLVKLKSDLIGKPESQCSGCKREVTECSCCGCGFKSGWDVECREDGDHYCHSCNDGVGNSHII